MKSFSPQRPGDSKSLIYCLWLLTLLAIPLLSIYGRTLEHNLFVQISREIFALLMAIVFTGAVIIYAVTLLRSGLDSRAVHLLWVGALCLYLYQDLPDVEKIHVVLFGSLGFLSRKLFQLRWALLGCTTISIGDEVLQHFLVDRVGDMRDVGINLFSACLGIFLSSLLTPRKKRNNN